MEDKKYTTERLSKDTIHLLNKIMEIKMEESIAKGEFRIKYLIEKKRITSYDDEINYLSRVWLEIKKNKEMYSKINKKIPKMNGLI